MKAIQGIAIYVLWLREMKRLLRAKSRLMGTLLDAAFFPGLLGYGVPADRRFPACLREWTIPLSSLPASWA